MELLAWLHMCSAQLPGVPIPGTARCSAHSGPPLKGLKNLAACTVLRPQSEKSAIILDNVPYASNGKLWLLGGSPRSLG